METKIDAALRLSDLLASMNAKRIAELEREVTLLKRALAERMTFTMVGYQAPLVAHGIPMPTQNQPEGNFWNPQL